MKKLLYIGVLFLLVISACNKKWDDHYTQGPANTDTTVISSLNLLDYLKTQPKYSKFVEALEKTKVADELTRDQFLTVWAVDNDAMAALASIGMTDTFVMKYHVNNLSFTLNKLTNGLRLKALNDKYIPVSINESGSVSLANATLVKGNQICKNGVVHEISELMVPIVSIYDYLKGLGDDYSIIRDSIFAQNVKTFDAANSTPLGVDKTGNTIYDSVFVIKNPIFNVVDFRSEYSQVTMFLPSNKVINECFENLITQYAKIGKTFAKADSVTAFTWIKQSIFFNQVISNYGSVKDLTSAYSKVWRTTVQKVNTTPHQMSNGLVYDVTYLKIPNNVYITRIKSLFSYYDYVPAADKPTLYKFNNCSTIQVKATDTYSFPTLNISGSYSILYLTGPNPKDADKLSVECNPVKLDKNSDGTTSASVMQVPPGEYKLYLGFQSSKHPYINVYFNDALVSGDLNVEPSSPWNYDRVNSTAVGSDGKSTKWDGLGGLVGTVVVPGDAMTTFKMKIEFSRLGKGTAEELRMYHWALVPTENNY